MPSATMSMKGMITIMTMSTIMTTSMIMTTSIRMAMIMAIKIWQKAGFAGSFSGS